MLAYQKPRCSSARTFLLITAAVLAVQTVAPGATMVLSPSKDNTLYEDLQGDVSNGQGEFLFAGKTGVNDGFHLRRALIAFDLSAIPAGSVVTGVSLSMFMSRSGPNPNSVNISLNLALKNWGEGASNAGSPGGTGAPAQTGDATWLNNFFNISTWTKPGGDFNPTASATTSVGMVNRSYSWSSASLVADVQGWLDNPGTNFGWFVIGAENIDESAQRFNSGENTSNPPQLSITYTIPEPSALALCTVGSLAFGLRRRRDLHSQFPAANS
jgi:hypothetical protein